MMPSTVKAITGRRSSQRSRSAAGGGTAGASPSLSLIIRWPWCSAREAPADSRAVGQAQRRPDLQAQPREDNLRLQKVALNIGSRVPPEVIFGRAIADDPDRDRARARGIGTALDQLTSVEVRQVEIDQDQCRDASAHEGIGFLSGAGVLERDAIAAKLKQIKRSEVLIVVDQEDPSLPRHISDIRRGSLLVALRELCGARCPASSDPAAGRIRFFAVRYAS